MKSFKVIITAVLLISVSYLYANPPATEIKSVSDGLTKNIKDKSTSKIFILGNGLKVIAISDPSFNKSSASMDVKVGSLMDPKTRPGLAHFLEHMLFLGTVKYPKEDEYGTYLKQQGGYSNAFTAGDHTNYHFEVNHDALEGALDRFSQFFIAPLFNKEFIEKEQNAINSEHQKNLQNDMWRTIQLLHNYYIKDHPASHFFTGNQETLKGIKRDEFVSFYNKYYSANQMSLAILSSKPISEIERLAVKYFSGIKNHNTKKITYPENYLDKKDTFRLIQIVPIKNIRKLSLMFATPSYHKYHLSKPARLIGSCIGHEGKGSLLSLLKAKNLANSLSAGGYLNTEDYGSFSIIMSLTEHGLKNYKEVIEICFSYINKLQKQGIPQHLFDEAKQLAAMSYSFDDKGEGTGRAVEASSNLNSYAPEFAENEPYLFKALSPEANKIILDSLTPDNMICTLSAQGLKTDKTEKWYGTKYSYTEDKAFYKKLKSPAEYSELALPAPNRFLSKENNLIVEQPVKLLDEPGAELWYLQDVEFKRPKVSLTFEIQFPEKLISPRNYALMSFYTSCLNEQLNEVAYEASEAGLSYSLSAGLRGLYLSISGYSSSTQKLYDYVLASLKKITISDKRFEAILDTKIRSWQNFEQAAAWQVARYYSRKLRKKKYFMPYELLKASQGITLNDVKQFIAPLYATTHINGMVHGNISAEASVAMLRQLQDALKSSPLSKDKIYEQGITEPKTGTQTYIHKVPSNNSALWNTLYLGDDSPKVRVASRIIGNAISQPYYANMRTKKQLGYIVWAVTPNDLGYNYIFFIIQSESHPADKLRDISNEFIVQLPEMLKAMPDAQFEQIKAAVKKELQEKPKSIAEKESRFFYQAFECKGDFDRVNEELAALDKVDKQFVYELLKKCIDPESRKAVNVLVFAKQHKMEDSTKATITDIDKYLNEQKFIYRK